MGGWRKVLLFALISLLGALSGPVGAKTPPDFDLPTVDGGRLKLSDFRGRVVVLDFFATWCRPCRSAMPDLDKLAKRYKAKGLSVIGYALDKEGMRKVKPFVSQVGIRFPVVVGNLKDARRLDPVKVLPTTLVIGPNGRILRRYEGVASKGKLLAAAKPYLSSNAPPEPDTAQVNRRRKGERRFSNVWATPNQILNGRQGFFVHVAVDVSDLMVEQGLWLAVHLRPEAQSGTGLAQVGEDKKLYQRVDDPSQKHFILFITCDQLPPAPEGGVFRSWVSVIDAGHKELERSGELIINSPGCVTAWSQ